jgi:hypothetical protein
VTLAEFLAARCDEDERLAQQALEEAGRDAGRETRYPYPDRLATCMHDGRHGPARALREVEAKRTILAWWENELRGLRSPKARELASRSLPGFAVIRLLAAVWSDHLDYDPSWKPEP